MIDKRIASLVADIAKRKSVPGCAPPTLAQITDYLDACFPGGGQFAKGFHSTMTAQHWQDRHRRPVRNWRSMAKRYASNAFVQ
jgi:hypothetical protein